MQVADPDALFEQRGVRLVLVGLVLVPTTLSSHLGFRGPRPKHQGLGVLAARSASSSEITSRTAGSQHTRTHRFQVTTCQVTTGPNVTRQVRELKRRSSASARLTTLGLGTDAVVTLPLPLPLTLTLTLTVTLTLTLTLILTLTLTPTPTPTLPLTLTLTRCPPSSRRGEAAWSTAASRGGTGRLGLG